MSRVALTLVGYVDPGEAGEHLEGGEAGIEVGLPRGDQPVAHQVSRAHKQRMRGV